ncbi:MAG: hypothetical protein KIT33_02585 [Candidatus Kapabacteria bacterium]|nr:hypothetical protein [Ignavibacteriota bacterium]MCW5883837.1 hypothetical protein [Candidatus Kapabacteria bacterium]
MFFLAAILSPDFFWGLNLWSYLGLPVIIAFTGGGMILLNKKTYLKFDELISNLKISNNQIIAAIIAFTILFIIFSQSAFFLGDGYLRIKNTEALQYYSSGSPLGNYITILFYDKILKPMGFPAITVWRIISYLAGIISLITFYVIGRKLFDDSKQFTYAGMILFSSAIIQMYFGYVESYPFFFTFLFGYYLSTLLMLKTGNFSLNPALWIISAFFISPTAVFLSPAVLYAYYEVTIRKENSQWFNFVLPVISVVFITVVVALLLNYLGFTAEKYYDGLTKVNHILSIFPSESDQGILDFTHFNDILNQIFLVSPGIFLIFFSLKNMRNSINDNSIRFTILSIILALLFMLIFRADISFVRDWDLFSIVAYPSLLLMILLFSRNNNYYGKYVIIVIGLLQTIPFIIINSNEKLSLERMMSISNISYLPDYAKSNNYDILRQYFKEGVEIVNPSDFKLTELTRFKIEKSLYYTELAYNYEKNERYLYNMALYAYVLKNAESAKKYLRMLLESDYDNKHLAYALLSKIFIDEGNLTAAIDELKKIEEIFPDNETPKLDLAHLYYNAGEPRNSYDYFKKAYSINPENEETLDYLIELSYLSDNRKSTIEFYRKYDKIKPGNPATYYNMALCFNDLKMADSVRYYAVKAEKSGMGKEIIEKLLKELKN